MEKLTLKPLSNEIVVNHGAVEGAVDLFCYAPDELSVRSLGSLYVVGHRENEASNMSYMVSLIAALARREYFADPSVPPREAFARTLRKANEVVDEFFRTGDVKLSVGIVAVAASQIMVSKLDKFRILLARDKQVIDILGNVMLFSKEHSEKRRFSSIIHGTIQAGDRILAFVPTRAVTSRERNLKMWFQKLPQNEFAQRIAQIGKEHASFTAAMLHIDIAQSFEPAVIPSPQPPELMPQTPDATEGPLSPSLATVAEEDHDSPVASWTPRQQSSQAPAPTAPEQAAEIPRIISSEFHLGTRRTPLSRLASRLRFIRFDTRGKAIALAVVVVVVAGGLLGAKSLFFVSAKDRQQRTAITEIRSSVLDAQGKIQEHQPDEARQLLTGALATLATLQTDAAVRELDASISGLLDSIDNAQSTQPTLVASPGPEHPNISLAAWASASQTIWVGGASANGNLWVAPVHDGAVGSTTDLGAFKADLLLGWKSSVLAVDLSGRTVVRTLSGNVKKYTVPAQDTFLDAAEFADSLFILTDSAILKVTDLDTDKPVMKRWLTTDDQLASASVRLWVDGSVYTADRDGTVTTYYKGKRTKQTASPISLTGVWRLTGAPDGQLAFSAGDDRRVYLVNPEDGSVARTLKIDSQIPYTYLSAGPNGSVLMRTAESKIWEVK